MNGWIKLCCFKHFLLCMFLTQCWVLGVKDAHYFYRDQNSILSVEDDILRLPNSNHCVKVVYHTHSGFLDLSQLSRASLLKAAVAALLLLLRWILAMVSEFFTTSMSPILFPVDKQPYGIILWVRAEIDSIRLV